MDKIKSVDHALEVLGHTTIDFNNFHNLGLPAHYVQAMIDGFKIQLVIEANNKLNNWQIDWNNSNQRKYSVWKGISANASKPSGFGFSSTFYDIWFTYASVGSRLHVGTREEALYIGKDFEDLFESAWLIIPPAQ